MLGAANIADFIKRRTEEHLQKKQAVSSKPIVMKFAYAHCPNLTIIDTPGFVFKVCSYEFYTSLFSGLNEVDWLFILWLVV
jgi:hypothetical protein